MIKKEKALLAAPQVVKKFHGLSGKENQEFVAQNFETLWQEHDVRNEKVIDVTEAYQLFNDLWDQMSMYLRARELTTWLII